MSVDEAVDFFTEHSRIHYPLKLLQDVGLGYIHLGQQSPSLSVGGGQRVLHRSFPQEVSRGDMEETSFNKPLITQ
jgi:excinuclease UvrABC ATPase subunit